MQEHSPLPSNEQAFGEAGPKRLYLRYTIQDVKSISSTTRASLVQPCNTIAPLPTYLVDFVQWPLLKVITTNKVTRPRGNKALEPQTLDPSVLCRRLRVCFIEDQKDIYLTVVDAVRQTSTFCKKAKSSHTSALQADCKERMDISSLLNPLSKAVAHQHRDVGQSRHPHSKHKSRRAATTQHVGGTQDVVTEPYSPQDDTKSARQRSHYQDTRVNGSNRTTTKAHKNPASRTSYSSTSTSKPLSPTSANPDHSFHNASSRNNGPLAFHPIQSRAKTNGESRRSLGSPAGDGYTVRSRPSSASSASVTTPSLAGYGSPSSTPYSYCLDSTLSPTRNSYTTSPTDSLAAFASVAIEDRLRSGHGSNHTRSNSQMSSGDLRSNNSLENSDTSLSMRHDQLIDSDEGSLSPGSSVVSMGSERPGGSDLEYLRRFKGKRSHRHSFGSDAHSDSSEVMKIPTLLGSPPRSLPSRNQYPEADIFSEDAGPRCSYTENCTTGSPLRKVVSHIFGRNKLCTRQIPKGVWVHYCRKHYQRSRYRNPKGFALLQCDLVRKQVDRLQLWGGVTDWIVKVRKREEVRLNKENAELAAGRLHPDEGSGDGEPSMDMNTNGAGSSGSSRWLVRCTGPGKSTAEVLDILNRIEQEIAKTGSNFPDVEILPNVVAEMARPSSSASTLSLGKHNGESLQHSPEFPPSRSDAVGGVYDPELGLLSRQRAAIEAERKRKASSSNASHQVRTPEPTEPKVRTLHRGLNPSATLPGGFVKRQRTRQLSDDEDEDEMSPETLPVRVASQRSPRRERFSLSQELPERVRNPTTMAHRPFLPSLHTGDFAGRSYVAHRGPSLSAYMTPTTAGSSGRHRYGM
ncbi:MAG: hypothetical protein M1837_000112 [Sclerophora amabilis]|nr:MAG: hypothetical protein M1837_000112 [Sclerophora amabilis]